MSNVAEKRRIFRQLHESGCFVIPNPWDAGSARYLESLGFPALATTSGGAAWSLGYADGHVPRDTMLQHIASIVAATDLPVNADFENGHAEDHDSLAEAVRLCVETGVAGLSIEDYTRSGGERIYDFDEAVARMRVARRAIDESGGDVMLVGRAEGLIRNQPDFDKILRRLAAYSEAGADCLYAPGLTTTEQVEAVVRVAAPKPVNVLIGRPGLFKVAELEALGVRRVSVGGSLARSAWGGFMRAAKRIADEGSFDGFADAAPGGELNALFLGRDS